MDEVKEAQTWMLERWKVRDDHPRWEQANGLVLCARLRTPASQSGWLLALYGSMLNQETSGDLDLLLVNWRENASKLQVIKFLRMNYDARVVDIHQGAFGLGVGMCTEDGHLIDMQFRTSVVRVEDELEVYAAH